MKSSIAKVFILADAGGTSGPVPRANFKFNQSKGILLPPALGG